MVFKRRSYRRPSKKTAKRSAAARPRRRVRPSAPTYRFNRMCTAITPLQGNAVHAPYTSSITVQFSNLINSSEFEALFDQYKITYVVHKFYMRVTPDAQTAATAVYPKLYWYVDPDDSTLPANLSEMRERSSTRMAVLRPDRPVVVKYKPTILQEIYRSGITTAYAPRKPMWLDLAYNNVIHYGVKYAIDTFTNTNYFLDVETKYYFACKTVR